MLAAQPARQTDDIEALQREAVRVHLHVARGEVRVAFVFLQLLANRRRAVREVLALSLDVVAQDPLSAYEEW